MEERKEREREKALLKVSFELVGWLVGLLLSPTSAGLLLAAAALD